MAEKITVEAAKFSRDPQVKAYVLRRAKGHCESCGNPAPFKTTQGIAYLEIHHLRRLADGGSDRVQNSVAVCPNCHRALHDAEDATQITEQIYKCVPGLIHE
jgi:5-methylcytosine-specific restriction protein A